MTEINLTEAEIMKAFECCKGNFVLCEECAYNSVKHCNYFVCDDVFDIINRKNAEIEKLNFENLQMIASIKNLKAEAIHEFAERLKSDIFKTQVDSYTSAYVIGDDDIDQIASEMGVEL